MKRVIQAIDCKSIVWIPDKTNENIYCYNVIITVFVQRAVYSITPATDIRSIRKTITNQTICPNDGPCPSSVHSPHNTDTDECGGPYAHKFANSNCANYLMCSWRCAALRGAPTRAGNCKDSEIINHRNVCTNFPFNCITSCNCDKLRDYFGKYGNKPQILFAKCYTAYCNQRTMNCNVEFCYLPTTTQTLLWSERSPFQRIANLHNLTYPQQMQHILTWYWFISYLDLGVICLNRFLISNSLIILLVVFLL